MLGNSYSPNRTWPVSIQDQTSEPIDLYLCKLNGTTNPTAPIAVDAKTVTVASATGAAVGDCINIRNSTNYFQSLITNVTGTTITFASPCDYPFTTSAIVCFGEWDISTANGSVTPVTFFMCPPSDRDWETIC